jgi:hypothetical protein
MLRQPDIPFAFGQYEVLATKPYAVAQASALQPEASDLRGGVDALTVATYNVLNLDPNDADGSADVAEGQFDAGGGAHRPEPERAGHPRPAGDPG